jgi:hypothetical protein
MTGERCQRPTQRDQLKESTQRLLGAANKLQATLCKARAAQRGAGGERRCKAVRAVCTGRFATKFVAARADFTRARGRFFSKNRLRKALRAKSISIHRSSTSILSLSNLLKGLHTSAALQALSIPFSSVSIFRCVGAVAVCRGKAREASTLLAGQGVAIECGPGNSIKLAPKPKKINHL